MIRPSRWRRTARLGRVSVRALLLSIALAAGFASSSAYAGTDAFCNNCTVSAGLVVYGPAHSLTAVRGTNNSGGAGCGGASGYGSYFCATPAGCHTYSSGGVYTPGIRHTWGSWRSMNGYSTWGSDGPPSNCGYSFVYGVGGPISAAAKQPEGIPVFERDAARAPKDVAALVPAADLSAARRFTTPVGDGWVLSDPEQRLVCLVVDDGGTGYGYSCNRLGEVQAAGTLVSFEDEDGASAAGDIVIAVAPEGVDGVEISRASGGTRTVPVERGVAVATLDADDRVVTLPKAADAPAGVKARRLVAGR